MIGKLSGVIDTFADSYFILDVQGVGYIINASSRTLSRVGQTGDTASVLVETNVREDAITLYGFIDPAEQSWFKLLTSVQGVGAKAALSILTVCPAEKLALIISAQDQAAIKQADGVGPKLATRILTELKDKAGKIDLSGGMKGANVKFQTLSTEPSAVPSQEEDAISALINLGYSRSDAYTAVKNASTKANDNDKKDIGTIIRLALKELSV